MHSPVPQPSTARRADPRIVLAVALLTAIAFLPSLFNGFTIWDDDVYLTRNPLVTHLTPENVRALFTGFHLYHYHPLTLLSFALEHALWGLWAPGYHLTNLLLHMANACLVFAVVRRIGCGRTASAATALLFGVHPTRVESVAWITERKDVLSLFFLLIAVLLYLRHLEKGRWGPYLGATAAHAASLLAKALGMTLAPLLWLIEWGRGDRMGWRRILNKTPFLALGLAAGLVTLAAQSGAIHRDKTAAVMQNLVLAARAFWFYLGKLIWPTGLSAIYSYPAEIRVASPGYLAAAAAFVLFLAGTLAVARRRRAWTAAWGFFLVSWLPFSGLVVYGTHFAADRYLYLPALGPFLLVGLGVERAVAATRGRARARNALAIVCAMAVGALMGTTAARCRVWRDSETLFRDVVAKDPRCVFALNNIGVALADQGRYAEAAPYYRKALAIAPAEAVTWANLGVALQALGRLDEALEAGRAAVAVDPKDAIAWNIIGSIHMQRREWPEALGALGEAVLIDPGHDPARENIRRVHLEIRRSGP